MGRRGGDVVCGLMNDSEGVITDRYTIRLILQSIPLLLFPSFLAFLARSGPQQDVLLTPLERFMAINYALLLLATALCVIIATPSPSPLSDRPTTTIATGHPMLVPFTVLCLAGAFIGWNYRDIGSLGVLFSLGNGVVGAWGFWTMLFAGSASFSRKTGADKHTSRFLFNNKAAASAQKKEWKKRQKQI